MKLFITTIVSLFTALASAATVLKRQTSAPQSPYSGTIESPKPNTAIAPGTDFDFQYLPSHWCESAYTPFTVYVTEGPTPPSFDDVTVNGTLAEGSYVLVLGKYVVSNFPGLPEQGISPPSSLNLPREGNITEVSAQLYLTVLQEFDACPGDIPVEYSLTSVPVALNTSAV